MNGRVRRWFCRRFNLYARVCLCLFLVSVAVYTAALLSRPFADFYTSEIGTRMASLLALVSSLLPFSLCEALLFSLPAIVVVLGYVFVRVTHHGKLNTVRMLTAMAATVTLLLSSFALTYGTGYRTTPLPERLGLSDRAVSAEQLQKTAAWLIGHVNEAAEDVEFSFASFSDMPYSVNELNDRLMQAYDKTAAKTGLFRNFPSRVKPVVLSVPMTYTHISGVYTFFTGEANINMNFPDYSLPYTAAHELAHQRGIAREDEANFVAFLVLINSDDAYLRYSGWLSMYEYFRSPLYTADPEGYTALHASLPISVRYELRAYADFFERYRENTAAKISSAVNDSFLQSQGQSAGTKSYGLVVDLCCAYYEANGSN